MPYLFPCSLSHFCFLGEGRNGKFAAFFGWSNDLSPGLSCTNSTDMDLNPESAFGVAISILALVLNPRWHLFLGCRRAVDCSGHVVYHVPTSPFFL